MATRAAVPAYQPNPASPGTRSAGQTAPSRNPDPNLNMHPWLERCFLGLLALLALWMLHVSSAKLFNFDEMLSYYTESVPTTRALLAIQTTIPVSLDPPLYHLLGHWALALGLNPSMAVRLPCLLGSFLMMAALYLYARRISGTYLAALALAWFVALNNFHLVEARPYGLLLGATALALVCRQNAVRGIHRRLSLVGLFLAAGLAVSSHYFGILVAVPFLVIECIRAWRRRRLDLPVAAALLGSYVFVAGWLPFLKAAHQYKSAYYIKVHPVDLARAYSTPFDTALKIHSAPADWAIAAAALVLVTACVYAGYRTIRCAETGPEIGPETGPGTGPNAGPDTAPDTLSDTGSEDWLLILLLALLPVAGVALAGAASGAFETRYVIGFTLGLALALNAGLLALVRPRILRTLLVVLMCALVAAKYVHDGRADSRQRAALAACSRQIAVGQAPGEISVVTDREYFVSLHHYFADRNPKLARLVWVADMPREIAVSGTDNIDRTMLNLSRYTDLPVISYDRLLSLHTPFQLIESTATVPRNWVGPQLRADHATLAPSATLDDLHFFTVQLPVYSR